MFKVFVILSLCCSISLAQYQQQQQQQYQQPAFAPGRVGGGQQPAEEPRRPHDFQYEVKDAPTGNDYGHRESSDGKVVSGSYHVLLPDGRVQIVTYRADENGYVADVQYQGEAKQNPSNQYNANSNINRNSNQRPTGY